MNEGVRGYAGTQAGLIIWRKIGGFHSRPITAALAIYSSIRTTQHRLSSIEHGGMVRSFDRGKSWEDVSKGSDYLDIPPHRQSADANGSILRRQRARFFIGDKPEQGWDRAENGLTGITFTLARRLDLTA